jgi:manganese efflux pump family protein
MVALLVVAVALGLNNFGAAIAIGVSGVDRRTEIKVATVFGLCDVVMPATGMLIGTGLAGPLGSAARWAGAGILFVTAVWGLIEALRGGDDTPQAWHGWRLVVSGAALSLDDLAVGLALGTVRYPIVLAVALFGLMSFVMSIIGLKLGGKLGTAAGEHGEVVGAIVLIGISGAMAMGWLLPGAGAAPGHTEVQVGIPDSSAVLQCHSIPDRSQPSVMRPELSVSLRRGSCWRTGIRASSAGATARAATRTARRQRPLATAPDAAASRADRPGHARRAAARSRSVSSMRKPFLAGNQDTGRQTHAATGPPQAQRARQEPSTATARPSITRIRMCPNASITPPSQLVMVTLLGSRSACW